MLPALLNRDPLELHVWEEALPKREQCGRAIASLFPVSSQRRIEAEWVVAWQEGQQAPVQAIRLASDEEHKAAMEEQADKINATPKRKMSISTPESKTPGATPRTLKAASGSIVGVTIAAGTTPKPNEQSTKPLQKSPPDPVSEPGSRLAPRAYTDADLEQRGWEILKQVLDTSVEKALVDFRSRANVGADGAIGWQTFVELKATGRGPQSSVELTNSEYERAKERGNDFILALVSGLEDGYQTEVRLIFDPANRATVRPLNGVKLVALAEAPAVVVIIADAANADPGEINNKA